MCTGSGAQGASRRRSTLLLPLALLQLLESDAMH
jgi:hypothetical protein